MKSIKTLIKFSFALIFISCFSELSVFSQTNFNSPENVVEELYKQVTFKKGDKPDWEKVKELFLDEAIIVLRTSRTENSIFSLDGFVSDFKRFIRESNVTETGFSETILKKNGKVFGDIAWFMVLYEAKIPGTDRKNLGVDHFSMVKNNGKWKIVSITNEIPTGERPIPEELAN